MSKKIIAFLSGVGSVVCLSAHDLDELLPPKREIPANPWSVDRENMKADFEKAIRKKSPHVNEQHACKA